MKRNNTYIYDYIDRYLRKKMTPEEECAFLTAVAADEELRTSAMLVCLMIKGLKREAMLQNAENRYIVPDKHKSTNKKTMKQENRTVYFNTRDELTKVCLDDVMYAVSDGNYITLKSKSGRTLTLLASMQNLMQVVESVEGLHFERVGRSHIINTAYLYQVNTLRKTITLIDENLSKTVELMAPKEAVRRLKQILADSPRRDIPDFDTSNGNMEAFQLIAP